MRQRSKNYAFIDAQNLHLGSKEAGLILDYKKFRIYLRDKYDVERAYMFIGYLHQNTDLYASLQENGFLLKFKPVLPAKHNKKQKGDVDTDLAFNMMLYYQEYEKAVLVSSDGDFDTLVKYLNKKDKLSAVLSPSKGKCSSLLQKAAGGKMQYLDDVGQKIRRS